MTIIKRCEKEVQLIGRMKAPTSPCTSIVTIPVQWSTRTSS